MGTAVVGARQTSAAPAAAAAATNALGPKIQFETPVHDFGRAKAGEPVKYTYVFTNTGDRLLVLNTVQPQCGCTTAGAWTKQVEPGNTGSIPIQFNTANYNGPVFKQVTVTCNITNQPTVFLQLKGTVYRPFDLNPPMAVLNIPPDAETASGVVTITNNTEEPLVLSAPESNNRAFLAELKTNAPGKGYQLIVSAVPPAPPGSVQGQVSLRTSWTNLAVLTVPVAVNAQPAVMVIPSYITLAPGPLANAVTNSVAIQNRSTNDLTLSEPVVNVPGVEARIQEMQPGRSFTALLAFPQGFEVPPGQQVELTVKSSNPKFPVVKVPVMQKPRPAPPPVRPTPPAKPVSSSAATPPPLPAGH
jgi:copper(I)-binding protein